MAPSPGPAPDPGNQQFAGTAERDLEDRGWRPLRHLASVLIYGLLQTPETDVSLNGVYFQR